jgi:NitT/TauT family transport system permease protein
MKQFFYTLLSLIIFFALWQVGYYQFGELILPSLDDVFLKIIDLLPDDEFLRNLKITLQRIFLGLSSSIILASILGVISGFIKSVAYILQPITIIILGMPVIAWIVLAMIWFGFSDTTIIFIVFIATFPIIFIGAYQGMLTIDNKLIVMADSFKLSLKTKLLNIYLPHLLSYIFPSLLSSIGLSWKIVIMAELMSSDDGIGAILGMAQTQLDTITVMALLIIMISLLLIIERLILNPLKQRLESWRN